MTILATSTPSVRYDQSIPFGWYCVALSKELKTSDVRPLTYFGKELVLFRTKSGQAVLLDAYCPHLGAHLGHGGKVNGESIACPFHGWEYNSEGYVTSIPYAKKIPPKVDGKKCIYSYPLIESNQLIWVWYHPQKIDPLWELDPISEVADKEKWKEYECHDFKIKSIIQDMGENAVDTAHFVYVHGTNTVPMGEIIVEGFRRSTDVDIRVPDLENPPADGEEPTFIDGKLYTRSIGPGQTVQIFDTFFYNIMIGCVTPIDSQTTHLRFCFSSLKEQPEMKGMVERIAIDEIVRQVHQDIPIWEHKTYLPNPALCDGDGPIAKYRKWFNQFYV